MRAQLRKSQQSDASFIHRLSSVLYLYDFPKIRRKTSASYLLYREPVTITARAQLKKSQGLVAFLKEQVDMHKKSIEKLHKERRETEVSPRTFLGLSLELSGG